MRAEPVQLVQKLSLFIYWNERMNNAMRKRYWNVRHLEATDQLSEEYAQWEEVKDKAYDQVKQFYQLTGGFPVVGDELHASLGKPGTYYPALRITKRYLFSSFGSDETQLTYEVEAESTSMEELEEYQEGDLVDEE